MHWGRVANNVVYDLINGPALLTLSSNDPTSRCCGPNQTTMAMKRKKEDRMKVESGGKMTEGLVDAHGEKEGSNNVSMGDHQWQEHFRQIQLKD